MNGNTDIVQYELLVVRSLNMAVVTAGWWFCSTNAAQAGRQYHHLLQMYISVKHCHHSQSRLYGRALSGSGVESRVSSNWSL